MKNFKQPQDKRALNVSVSAAYRILLHCNHLHLICLPIYATQHSFTIPTHNKTVTIYGQFPTVQLQGV